MSDETLSNISETGRSIWYKCKRWDWALAFAAQDAVWQHICLHPNGYKPGDAVITCEGFTPV